MPLLISIVIYFGASLLLILGLCKAAGRKTPPPPDETQMSLPIDR